MEAGSGILIHSFGSVFMGFVTVKAIMAASVKYPVITSSGTDHTVRRLMYLHVLSFSFRTFTA